MKLLAVLFAITLAACSSLSNPQGAVQPVLTVDYKSKIYKTTCNGAVEDWGACFGKANKSCVNGYLVLDRFETPVGGRRELTFKCKNSGQ